MTDKVVILIPSYVCHDMNILFLAFAVKLPGRSFIDCQNNVKRQKFRYRRMPKIQGKTVTMNQCNVTTHCPVQISFKPNKGKNDYGNFEMSIPQHYI